MKTNDLILTARKRLDEASETLTVIMAKQSATLEESRALQSQLMEATSAAIEFHNRVRGMPAPKTGD